MGGGPWAAALQAGPVLVDAILLPRVTWAGLQAPVGGPRSMAAAALEFRFFALETVFVTHNIL